MTWIIIILGWGTSATERDGLANYRNLSGAGDLISCKAKGTSKQNKKDVLQRREMSGV
jgi:hypothetical protein